MTFCYWNAASYVMMSKEQRRNESPADATKRAMYLTLAEKMLQKAYDDGKMEYNGEYLLFLNILEEKGKYVDALRIVDELDEQAHAATLGYVDFKAKKRMEYLSKLERWSPDLVELCEQHIAHTSQSNMNDWPCYQLYVKAVAEAVKSAESGGDLLIQREEVPSDLLSECRARRQTARDRSDQGWFHCIHIISYLLANEIHHINSILCEWKQF